MHSSGLATVLTFNVRVPTALKSLSWANVIFSMSIRHCYKGREPIARMGRREGDGAPRAKARKERMPMTGLGAIWAAGTICTVGETERGLIMGQHPIPPIHLPPPVSAVHSPTHCTITPLPQQYRFLVILACKMQTHIWWKNTSFCQGLMAKHAITWLGVVKWLEHI